jgi:hypothetical protein
MNDEELSAAVGKISDLAKAPCHIFPDGQHGWEVLTNTAGSVLLFAKHCPCGAFVGSPALDREAFEASGRDEPVVRLARPRGDGGTPS